MRYAQALPNFAKWYIAGAVPARRGGKSAARNMCQIIPAAREVSRQCRLFSSSTTSWEEKKRKKYVHAPAFYLRRVESCADADLS